MFHGFLHPPLQVDTFYKTPCCSFIISLLYVYKKEPTIQ